MTAPGATDALSKDQFLWVAGIEDTCVYPPPHFAMNALDEYDLTGHSQHWKTDLDSIRDLGATAVRYGVNWPLAHTSQDRFDWSVLDERLRYATADLGLTVIADLVHYGTPTWLEDSFADPRYPGAIADFAGQFAARYQGMVNHLTPLNEPLTTASFCGLRGIWPPALTGWDGWVTVVLSIVEGMAQSITAIRSANADAVIVHVEASSLFAAQGPHLDGLARHLEAVGTVPTDLLLGRVNPGHAMYDWLLAHGADAPRLHRLTVNPPRVDIIGVNYYPDLTPRTLTQTGDDVAQIPTNRWGQGLKQCLRAFAGRYALPLLVTETSIEGDDQTRAAWVDSSVRAVQDLLAEGLDVRGYTWWPLFDFVDWSYASGGRNVEEFVMDDAVLNARTTPDGQPPGSKTPFLRRMGLFRLDEQPDGHLTRVRTAAADRFSEHALHLSTRKLTRGSRRAPVYQPYFADPFLTRFGHQFIAYGSGDPARTDGSTFEAIRSPDLRVWTSAPSVLEPIDPAFGDTYWAPEVIAAAGAYWMYFSLGRGITGHHIRVARSADPLGPFIDQGVNLTPNETFAIDPHPFQDADGTWYLYFARDVLTGNRPGTHLAAARMTSMTTVDPDVVPVLAPDSDWQIYQHNRPMYGTTLNWHTLEGPTVLRHSQTYLLFFSGGSWEGDGYGVSVATAPTPLGPWTHRPSQRASFLTSTGTGLIGPGHNSVLHTNDGDLLAFHAWNPQRTARQMYIEQLIWPQGSPVVR